MRRALSHLENERGATLLFVGLLLVALLSLSTLAVDVGVWLNTRSEAQRVADSAALAGAGVFLLPGSPHDLALLADDTARHFAAKNYVGRTGVNPDSDLDVTVVEDSQLVRVTVRGGTPPLFAWLLGFGDLQVSARAAARVFQAGSARCLKPFAVPDIWHDQDGDLNGNRIWEEGEIWEFGSDPGDYYSRFDGDYANTDSTGYGGPRRDQANVSPGTWANEYQHDFGRQLTLKVTDPNANEPVQEPSVFFPWSIPEDENMEQTCTFQGGATDDGAAAYRANICNCNTSSIVLGQDYPILTGNMVGPTNQGVKSLVDEDPNAKWEEYVDSNGTRTGKIIDSEYSDPMESPRVIKIALFDPTQITSSGMQTIKFNNFALFFIEEQQSPQDPVKGRFLNYVAGETAPVTGSLVKVLQLVE